MAIAPQIEKGKRLTGKPRENAAAFARKSYEAGKSIRWIANATGRSYGATHRLVVESGVTLRSRGGHHRSR